MNTFCLSLFYYSSLYSMPATQPVWMVGYINMALHFGLMVGRQACHHKLFSLPEYAVLCIRPENHKKIASPPQKCVAVRKRHISQFSVYWICWNLTWLQLSPQHWAEVELGRIELLGSSIVSKMGGSGNPVNIAFRCPRMVAPVFRIRIQEPYGSGSRFAESGSRGLKII